MHIQVRLDFIEPMLRSLVEKPPSGADWIHEVKHDSSNGRLFSLNGFYILGHGNLA